MEPEPFSIATTGAGQGIHFSRAERERHLYIVGKSGSGKSTFMFNLGMGDIAAGHGVGVIDPHGDLALDILDAIPPLCRDSRSRAQLSAIATVARYAISWHRYLPRAPAERSP
jgi:hypothetical protein